MSPDIAILNQRAAEAVQKDNAYYAELEEKIGAHPAAIISECANLVMLSLHGMPLKETSANILGNAIKAFNLNEAEILQWVRRAVEIRRVRV